MSDKKSTERKYGGKTAIGDAAAQRAFDKNFMKDMSRQERLDAITSARDEADNEVQREMTRGVSKSRSGRRDRR